MCQHQENTGGATATGEDKFRLADFFDRWWDTYKQSPSEYIAPEQYKAVNAMRVCRTEALGVDYYACPDCGEVTKVYHSCKNRFCPTCSWKDTVRWADRLKNQMMDLPHRHTVMTLPHQFNHLIKENKKGLLSALMRVAADTLKDWMAHKYNINPGIISVLHTFGETKEFHVHVHMIVSWGGLDIKTKELRPIKGEYIDYNFLKNKFRCKFEDQLVAMYDNGTLEHNFSDRIQFLKFIKSANQNKWIIHLEPPMDIPTQVIRYIGRYSKRACLSEYKIIRMDGEKICFRYKDYKTLDSNNKPIERELEMNYRDFFPRLLQHVPLPYFRIVRYYGMYANRSDIPLQYLYNETEETKTEDRESVKMEETAENPLVCSYCQTRKVYLYTKLKSRYANKTIVFKRVFINNSKPHDQIAA